MSLLSVVNLAQEMKRLKAEIDELGDRKTQLQKEYDQIRFSKLPDAMDEDGIDQIRIEGVGTVYLTDDINVSVTDKDNFYNWLGSEGFGDLIKPYIFPQSVKAFVKEQLAEGNELPEGFVKVSAFTRAAIRSK